MPGKTEKLELIARRLKEISEKLDRILKFQKSDRESSAVNTLTQLPKHLKKTASSVAELGEATAMEVAGETGRARAAESDYLNQLADRGLLRKERKGRSIYFKASRLYTECNNCGATVLATLEECPMCGSSLHLTVSPHVPSRH